jgi:hypothetical protein
MNMGCQKKENMELRYIDASAPLLNAGCSLKKLER